MSRLIFMLLICPSFAYAQSQLPSDVDLKAAYCIPIARYYSQITVSQNLPDVFRESLRDTKEKGAVNLRRLNLYLVPRISKLDAMSLIGASRSAQEDLERSDAEFMKCDSMNTTEQAWQCFAVETETLKRLRSCNVLSFLPF